MADEKNENTLAQLAIDKKPAEFKAAVGEKLNGMLKSAIDTRKTEVASNLITPPQDD
jgi:hypothetical protein